MTASPSSINQDAQPKRWDLKPVDSIAPNPILRIVEQQGQLHVHMASYNGSFPMVLSEALRSAGLGSRVVIAQLLKGGVNQGAEHGINLCGRLTWLRPNLPCYLHQNKLIRDQTSNEFSQAKEAVEEIWEICKENLLKETIHKLVLDEIGLAIKLGLIQEKEVIQALLQRPSSIDVILTGPFIPNEVIAMADQVTEMRCTK